MTGPLGNSYKVLIILWPKILIGSFSSSKLQYWPLRWTAHELIQFKLRRNFLPSRLENSFSYIFTKAKQEL